MLEIVRIETMPFISKRQRLPRIRFYQEDRERFLSHHGKMRAIYRMADHAINVLSGASKEISYFGQLKWDRSALGPGKAGFKVNNSVAAILPSENIVIYFTSRKTRLSRYEQLFGELKKQF